MPKEFLFFEKGKYPQGDYSNMDILNEFVDRFNNTKLRMSFFVGHKYPWDIKSEDDELAHGEGLELRINQRGQIFMVNYECDDYLKEKIAKRQLLWCSPEIIGDPAKQIDITGLAFLGRTPPQNLSAIVPALFGFDDKEKIKSYFIGIFKLEKDFTKSFLIENKKEEDQNPMTEEEKKAFAIMQNTIKTQGELLEKLDKQQTQFQKSNTEEDAKVFFSKLKDDGRILPALTEKFVSFDSKLTDEQRKEYRKLFSETEKIVDTSGKHTANKPEDENTGDVYSQIKVFQAENKIKSFEEAATAFHAKHPELFSDE